MWDENCKIDVKAAIMNDKCGDDKYKINYATTNIMILNPEVLNNFHFDIELLLSQ